MTDSGFRLSLGGDENVLPLENNNGLAQRQVELRHEMGL